MTLREKLKALAEELKQYAEVKKRKPWQAEYAEILAFKLATLTIHTEVDLLPLCKTFVEILQEGNNPDQIREVLDCFLNKNKKHVDTHKIKVYN